MNIEECRHQLAQKEAELDVIMAIDHIRDVATSPQEMFSSIVQAVGGAIEADACLAALADEESGSVRLKAIEDHTGALPQIPAQEVQRLMERAMLLDEVTPLELPRPWQEQGIAHGLAAPLTIESRRLGALVCLNRERPFTPEQQALLRAAATQIDSAVVQARTMHALRQRHRQLEAIYRIDRIRDAATDTQELLTSIANVVTEYIDADLCLMSLVDEDTGSTELKVIHDRQALLAQADQTALRQMAEQATYLDEVMAQETPPDLHPYGLWYMLAASLTVGGERLGSLLLFSHRHPFSADDRALLEAVVSQADSAVLHARTFHRLQQRNKELETIYRVDRIRDEELEFSTMLTQVLNELCRVIDAEMGFIMLYDRWGKQLELKASTADDIFAVTSHYQVIQRVADEALQRAELVVRQDLDERIHSTMCIPLILRNEIIGVFGAVNRRGRRRFTRDDRRLLKAIASQIDTAIFESQEKRRLRTALERNLSPQVMEWLLRTPERDYLKGERVTATLLFSDMRNFTGMSERTTPGLLVEMLNEHLGAMTQVVLAHHGTLDKFVGDEVVAIFGAPWPQEDHALRAVQTALEMQRVHGELMARWQAAGREAVPIGIGINSGEVMAGYIGCERLMNYTAIGDNVNLASRLCDAAKGGQVLISEATYRLVVDAVDARPLPPLRVQGKSQPVQAYEVLGLK